MSTKLILRMVVDERGNVEQNSETIDRQERVGDGNEPCRSMSKGDLLIDVDLDRIVVCWMFGSCGVEEIEVELHLTVTHGQIGELFHGVDVGLIRVVDEEGENYEESLSCVGESSKLEGEGDALILILAVGSVGAGWTETDDRCGGVVEPEL